MRIEPILFPPVQEPLLFSARGCLWGSFTPSEKRDNPLDISGTFTTKEGREFATLIKKNTWKKLIHREDYQPHQPKYWRVYFRTTESAKISQITLIRVINVNFPIPIDSSGELLENYQDLFFIRGKIKTIDQQEFVVSLHRNEPRQKPHENYPDWQWDLTIQGHFSLKASPEQFCEILACRQEDYIRFQRGQLIENPPVGSSTEDIPSLSSKKVVDPIISITEKIAKAWETRPKLNGQKKQLQFVKLKKQSSPQSEQTKRQDNRFSPSKIIMIDGQQAEITLKFTQKPLVPEQGKKLPSKSPPTTESSSGEN